MLFKLIQKIENFLRQLIFKILFNFFFLHCTLKTHVFPNFICIFVYYLHMYSTYTVPDYSIWLQLYLTKHKCIIRRDLFWQVTVVKPEDGLSAYLLVPYVNNFPKNTHVTANFTGLIHRFVFFFAGATRQVKSMFIICELSFNIWSAVLVNIP